MLPQLLLFCQVRGKLFSESWVFSVFLGSEFWPSSREIAGIGMRISCVCTCFHFQYFRANFVGTTFQIVQKTFIGEGEEKKAPNQVAGEILSFFTRNNFVVTDRGETIT